MIWKWLEFVGNIFYIKKFSSFYLKSFFLIFIITFT